jgi:hypothetical protein
MKYINQRDYPHWLYITRTNLEGEEREKGKTTTVKTSGCGLCAAVMMADQLLPNCDFDLNDAMNMSYALKANHLRGTDYEILAPVLSEKLGLRYEIAHDVADVHRCLRTGGSVVALVQCGADGGPGLFTNSGHFINVIGYEPDGRFVILDPSFFQGKYDIPERKGRVEIRYDYLILCDEQTLAGEGSTKYPPFYLFWRK